VAASKDQIETLLDQFVRDLKVRTKATSYRCVVRRIHEFLGNNGIFSVLDQRQLRKWLRAQLPESPFWLVVHRAQLVTRFLDWLVKQKIVRVNPFAELRQKYECRSTARIVRALVSSKPSAALEALRPPPRYGSHARSHPAHAQLGLSLRA
jgi:site-specific recombinase XerC